MSADIQDVVDTLNNNGFYAKAWFPRNGGSPRVYVKMDGKDIGYLVESDFAGQNGSCNGITRRKGFVAGLLRDLATPPAPVAVEAAPVVETVPTPEVVAVVEAPAPVAAPKAAPSTNRRPGFCEACGVLLQAGEGALRFCLEDSGCAAHHNHSGYHLRCSDSAACGERQAANKAAKEAAKLEAARKADEASKARDAYAAVVANMTKGLVALDTWPKGEVKRTLVASVGEYALWALDAEGCLFRQDVGTSSFFWYSPSKADEVILAWGDERGGEEAGHAFLAKYAGCKGASEWKRYFELKGTN